MCLGAANIILRSGIQNCMLVIVIKMGVFYHNFMLQRKMLMSFLDMKGIPTRNSTS